MGRLATVGVVLASVWAAAVAADVRRTPSGWELENAALRVAVDAQTARLTVCQKATGLVWEQDAPAVRRDTAEDVRVPRFATPPAIDGDDRDWTADGMIWLPWVGQDGERNCSAGARVGWDERYLYLHVRVRDQLVAFGSESPQEWWEADSVEFWVDSVQVGLHLYAGGPVAVDPGGAPYEGARVAVKLIPEQPLPGYAVEAAIPIEHFPILREPASGVRFYFAIGINDADPQPGEPVRRVAQGYYPSGWVHSEPHTFSVAVLTDQDGAAPPVSRENDRTSVLFTAGVGEMRAEDGADAVTYSYTAVRNQPSPLALRVRIALVGQEPALDVTLSSQKGDGVPMDRLYCPQPLYPPAPQGYYMAMADYCDGRYVWVGDERFRGAWLSACGSLDMPWLAVTAGRQGMMVLVLTPADAVIWMQPRRDDKEQLGFPGVLWEPSKGRWGGARRARLIFFDRGGHVAACKAFRRYAQETGYFRTLTDKAKDNPDVLKLMGAVDWWGADGLRFVREATAEGITRGLVNGRWPPEDMAEMVRLGWLVGEYDNYVDIDDAPAIAPQKAPVKEHAVVQADGTLMTAWINRDENMNPVHTMMKHCTAMQLESAKTIIPGILNTYPYNARFLDVTPAEGPIECWSAAHPTDRASDLLNRQALCRYVSQGLGLVTGGEHGRFWDVPYLHYHEGMMGGGMYGWPAGYLQDVKDRQELGADYLKYGINPANRAPLFELVYHDCVVDYWYWGATNDYLHQVAPEITDRKTAMNVLYGTPPMMWVHSHGLRWHVPREREQMLAIYRNVCKLHEVIGTQEMVSHEFLTPDRMVQRTTWEDGTTCTVNFGTATYRIAVGGRTLELGTDDYYVHGPQIEQWRATEVLEGQGRFRQTVIRREGYLFVDAGEHGFHDEAFRATGQVTVERATPHRAVVTVALASSFEILPAAWWPGEKRLPVVHVMLDEAGHPEWRRDVTGQDGFGYVASTLEGAHRTRHLILAGEEALKPDVGIAALSLSSAGRPVDATTALRVEDVIEAAVKLDNAGLSPAEGMKLEVRLDGPAGPVLSAFENVSLSAGASATFTAHLPAAQADGPRQVVAFLTAAGAVSLTGRTEASAGFTGPVDLARFPVKHRYVVQVPGGEAAGTAVEVPFDLRQADGQVADPGNLRASFGGGLVAPAQFEAASEGAKTGTLVFCLPPGLAAGQEVVVQVLAVPEGSDSVVPHASGFDVAPDGSHIRMGSYAARISNGVLGSIVVLKPSGEEPVMESIIVSSAETGWSAEEGRVEEFSCLARGPVRAVFACSKLIEAGHRLRRRWRFYADRFEVESEVTPPLDTLTRARYAGPGTATNATGRSAQMDGQGNADDFGFQGSPQWYAVFSDRYRNACIALTPAVGFTYWDDGGLGQISLNHGGVGPERRLYLLGPGARDDAFARGAAQAYAQPVSVRPAE